VAPLETEVRARPVTIEIGEIGRTEEIEETARPERR
jgi:hypothetical protein